MAGFSDHLEDELLDHVFGGADYTRPTTLYLALYTAAPSDAGGGTQCAGRLVRQGTGHQRRHELAASGGAKSNGTAITFPQASAAWGTVTHFGIFDAATSGDLLCWGALTASKTIDAGDTPSFAAGELDITLD